MIPKIIHYCWFGGNPLPELAQNCIESWKTHCNGYRIVRWDESNFDINSSPLYVRQAYETKKWAFVTDYVRLYVMVNYGGIYMDTDVEVLKSLDTFLHHQAFSGFENDTQIPTGIMASEKGFPLFKNLLQYYDDAVFLNKDGTMNFTTNVVIITNICFKYGFQPNNSFQNIEGFVLYPKDYFCPFDNSTKTITITENTATIHHFSGSWVTNDVEKQRKMNLKKQKLLIKKSNFKHWILKLPNRTLRSIIGDTLYEKFKTRFIDYIKDNNYNIFE